MKTLKLSKGYSTLVDNDLFPMLNAYSWYAKITETGVYAVRSQSIETNRAVKVYMHHCIIGFPLGNLVVDHISGNPLDNRRVNLRLATKSENCWNHKRNSRNTSGVDGVRWDHERRKWSATIQFHGVERRLGRFAKRIDAVSSRKYAENLYFGEFKRAV